MKLIQTKEYLLLIDEEAEIKQNSYFLLRGKYINVYKGDKEARYKTHLTQSIIAYYPLSKEAKELDLPLLPNPFNKEVDETTLLKNLGHECFLKMKELNPSGGIKEFIRMAVEFGYKTAQSKQFSLDDIKKAFHTGRLYQGREGDTSLEELIQSLSTQQLPKEFIPEYRNDPTSCLCVKTPCTCKYNSEWIKTITNSEGKQELVGTYK